MVLCLFLLGIVSFFLPLQGQDFIIIEAPENVQVTSGSVESTSMWITWSPVPKADSYMITLQPPTIGASGIGSGITEPNSMIEGLVPNTEYLVTIRAVQGDVIGNPAVISQQTALPSPNNVWAIEDSVTENSMTVQWTEVEDAQSYTVEVSPSTGVGGGGRNIYATQARLRGMSPNTLYTIHIYPVNWVGSGTKATLKQYTKLNPPRNLVVVVATVSPSTIGIQWSAVGGAENYLVRVTPSTDNTRSISPLQDTRYVLRNLDSDTEYRIQVAAVNSAGPSEFASINQRTKSMCYAVSSDFTEDTFSINCPSHCQRVQTQVYGTREYTADSFICAAAIHDGRINSNRGGRVVVKKRPGILDFVGTYNNGIRSKDYKNWHQSYVFALQTPENVQIQDGSVSHDRFTLTWDPVSGAVAYRITVNPSEGVIGINSNVEDTRITLRGLLPNTTYQVFVSAVNRVETSDGSIILQRTALAAPENLQVLTDSVTFDSFVIAWNAMGSSARLQYQVQIIANQRVVIRDLTTLTSYTARNLTSGTLFDISVRAMNEIGLGNASRISQYTMIRRPTNLRATAARARNFSLEWTPVPGAISFNVLIMPLNVTIKTQDYFTTINNLQPDSLYRIHVDAENANNRSDPATIELRTSLPSPNVSIVPGSLKNDGVNLTWNTLNRAYYSVVVNYVSDEGDEEEIYSANTNLTSYHVTDLREKRLYRLIIKGINMAGTGESSSLDVTTLIAPPSNLRVFSDGLRSTFAYFQWDETDGITEYYLMCEPSENLQGLGIVETTSKRVTGFRFGTTYFASVMAISPRFKGMNSSVEFSVQLPSPKLIVVHSVTTSSMTIDWDPDKFKISSISYNTSSINRITLEISEAAAGRLVLPNLRPNTFYQINVYSEILWELFGHTGVQRPILMQTVITGSTSNLTDVTVFWPEVQSNSPVNYLISTDPIDAFKRTNVTTNSIVLSGVRTGEVYSISVTSENWNEMVVSDPATLQFQQSEGDVLFGTNFVSNEINNGREFYELDRGNQLGTDNGTNERPLSDYNENDFNDIPSDDAKHEPTDQANRIWIPIVVIVGCIFIILLLILIPSLCCYNKPILKNYGFCVCCCNSYV